MATNKAQVGALLKDVITKGVDTKDAIPTIKQLIEAKVFSLQELTVDNMPHGIDPKIQQKLLPSNNKKNKNKKQQSNDCSSSHSSKRRKTSGNGLDDTSSIIQPPLASFPSSRKSTILINRSPVLILWATIVAMELYSELSLPEALSIGSAVAAHMAHAKGSSLGIYGTSNNNVEGNGKSYSNSNRDADRDLEKPTLTYRVLGIDVLAHQGTRTLSPSHNGEGRVDQGVRAIQTPPPGGTRKPTSNGYYHNPLPIWKRLQDRFQASLGLVMAKMRAAARAAGPQLESTAYRYYMHIRPDIPAGTKGWGAHGYLEVDKLDGFYPR